MKAIFTESTNFLNAAGCETMDELLKLTTEELVEATQKAAMADTKNMLGMEVGILRKDVSLSPVPGDYSATEFYPPESECMTIEQMILGYTINGAKQLHLEKTKGSIEVGKDADYLVLNENLLEISAEGMKNIVPEEVYFSGVKMN